MTSYTEGVLPAVATGLQLDLGLVFVGMVLPFWAVIGGLIGLIITVVMVPMSEPSSSPPNRSPLIDTSG